MKMRKINLLVMTLMFFGVHAAWAEDLKIFVAGDVCPAYRIDKGQKTFFTNDAEKYISDHDVSIMNFETSTAHNNMRVRKKEFVFYANPNTVEGLKMFNMFVTANNHCFDTFENGWIATRNNLNEKGIDHNGVYDGNYKPLVINKKGYKVVLISGTIWGSSMGKYKTLNPQQIVNQLLKLGNKDQKEIRIVYIHGDQEYLQKTSRQAMYSKSFKNAGADIIIWSHSHVYGPVEMIGNTIVAYGMGNFMFGGNSKWKNNNNIKGISITISDANREYKWVRFKSNNYRISLD